MSGLGTCRDCNAWIYWGEYTAEDGSTKHVPYDEPGCFTMHWQTCSAQDWVTDQIGTMYRVTRCKDCGHTVYWETTARGKKRPMDCYQDDDTEAWVADGECHFETCVTPRANRYSTTNNWRAQDSHRARSRPEPARNGHTSPSELERLVRLWGPDLGLAWPCTREQVVAAFRQHALKHHPDMGGQAQDFIKVKRAYDALKDRVPV